MPLLLELRLILASQVLFYFCLDHWTPTGPNANFTCHYFQNDMKYEKKACWNKRFAIGNKVPEENGPKKCDWVVKKLR